jgi:ComF family protein
MKTGVEKVRALDRLRPFAAAGGRFVAWCRGSALDLVFPAACAGCGEELEATGEVPICEECLERLPLFRGATCRRCGAPVAGESARAHCYRCAGTKLWFDETLALGEYTGLLREWLLEMKHQKGEALALSVAELVWQRQRERLTALQPDVIVPVPMHWRRRLVRGANSPVVLAERLAVKLGAPLAADLLRRTRHTQPQFSLPPSERQANVRNAFAVRPGYYLNAAHVLLVDDIFTTGSTCSAAARALKKAGAQHVAVVVTARTLRH